MGYLLGILTYIVGIALILGYVYILKTSRKPV